MKEMMKIFKFLAFTIIIQTGVAIALPIHHHLDSFADIEILYRKAQFDTVRYNYRELDQNQLENFRSDSVFNYRINTKKGTTLWERILIWLTDFIQKLFYASGRSSAGKFIIYSLIAGALIFSVLKLINIRPSSLISKPLSKNLSFKIASENIHEIPFESQIEDAIENKNYKLAIRLYYLFALKKNLQILAQLSGRPENPIMITIMSWNVRLPKNISVRSADFLNMPGMEDLKLKSLCQIIQGNTLNCFFPI